MDLNTVTDRIIGAAIEVPGALGPGLLESAYEACMTYELADRRLMVERQKPLPVTYQGVNLDCGYRIDLLVEQQVMVELKAVTQIERIHVAQLLSYLRLSRARVGLLINFHSKQLADGVRRFMGAMPS